MEIWLIIGVICLIIEFSAIPNIGFLFLGFGALSNYVILYYYPLSLHGQCILFATMSLLWLALLWWPLRKYIYKNNPGVGYSDLIGKAVEVYSEYLTTDTIGQVKWSGVIMNAKLSAQEQSPGKAGDTLFVVGVQGNILVCSKSHK